jgi:hypothetical protein
MQRWRMCSPSSRWKKELHFDEEVDDTSNLIVGAGSVCTVIDFSDFEAHLLGLLPN